MELNFEGLEMQGWNTPTNRVQRVEEKNGVYVGSFIMFTPGIVVIIKMSKMAHFFVFSADDNKNSVIVWEKHLSASERSCLALSGNGVDYWILSYQ